MSKADEFIADQKRRADIIGKLNTASFFAVAEDGTIFELRRITITDRTEVAVIDKPRVYRALGLRDFGRKGDLVTVKLPKAD